MISSNLGLAPNAAAFKPQVKRLQVALGTLGALVGDGTLSQLQSIANGPTGVVGSRTLAAANRAFSGLKVPIGGDIGSPARAGSLTQNLVTSFAASLAEAVEAEIQRRQTGYYATLAQRTTATAQTAQAKAAAYPGAAGGFFAKYKWPLAGAGVAAAAAAFFFLHKKG